MDLVISCRFFLSVLVYLSVGWLPGEEREADPKIFQLVDLIIGTTGRREKCNQWRQVGFPSLLSSYDTT